MIGIKKVLGLLPSLFFFSVCLFGGEANAGLMLNAAHDAWSVAEGQKAQYNFVGAMEGVSSSNVNDVRGSAVLVHERLVQVTNHQLLNNLSDPSSFYSNIKVSFGSNVNNGSQRYDVVKIFTHGSKDLAFLELATPVLFTIPAQYYTGPIGVGTEVTQIGFGNRQYVNDPLVEFTGDRRVGFDVIDGVNVVAGGDILDFQTTFNRSFNPNYRENEYGGRPRDSGGALLVNGMFAATFDSISISSTFNAGTFYTKNDILFYENTVANLTAVPEPTSLILFGTAVTGFVPFLRKRKSKKA